ncbi:MAG: hypothetical protein ABSE57_34535 [Bryobacteraceae bacterium]
MKLATQSRAQELPIADAALSELGFFSSESVLHILKLILAGAELPEVLAIIARLVESQGNGTLCTIWLPDADGKQSLLRGRAGNSWICRERGANVDWPERRILKFTES